MRHTQLTYRGLGKESFDLTTEDCGEDC
jgi:hypothetical protein